MGGIFVTILAPRIFTGYFELHVGLWLCFVLAAVAFWYGSPYRSRSWWPIVSPMFVFLGATVPWEWWARPWWST